MHKTGQQEPIRRFMAPNGRVDYKDLQGMAEEHNEQRFVQLLRYHSLVGVTILPGEIKDDPNNANSTKIFDSVSSSTPDSGSKSFDLTKVIFPLTPGQNSGSDDLIYVGQGDDNNIIISDYSISHDHVSIRIDDNGRHFLKDRGSKNSTMLRGEVCKPGEEVEIASEDTVQIGRYQFILLSPGMLYAHLRGLDIRQSIMGLINHLGKADYNVLKKLANWQGEDIFINLVRHPALVGVALFKGYLVDSDPQHNTEDDDDTGDETMLFMNEKKGKQQAVIMNHLSRTIFPIVHRTEKVNSRDTLTIGRSKKSDLCMDDNSISRTHAQVRIAGGGHYYFTDFESQNGSWINGKKIGEGETALCEGDKVKIGRYLFTFVFPSTLYRMLKNKN
jgi:pSer/pThr/pTyr-binding forkhead associated (FHA) protein